MTQRISIASVGLLRQTELQLSARNDALRRNDAETRTVTVEIERPVEPSRSDRTDGDGSPTEPQTVKRLVDIKI